MIGMFIKLMLGGLIFVAVVLFFFSDAAEGAEVLYGLSHPGYEEAKARGLPNEEYLEMDIDCEEKCDIMNGSHTLTIYRGFFYRAIECHCAAPHGAYTIW